ncbi:MAG: hypothetical protein V4689_17250 [Verrucomicrobiota bacterium]
MFKRILVEDWATWVPIISFILIAGVFIVVTVRALRISPTERKHLESLPLEDSES